MHIVTKASYFNQLKVLNFYTKFERFKGKKVLFYKSAQSFFMYPINIIRMTVPYCTEQIHIPLYVPFQWAVWFLRGAYRKREEQSPTPRGRAVKNI
jgi:hypothetical protein